MPFLSFSPTSGMDRSENSLNGHSNSMSEMKKHRDSVSTKKAAVTFIPSQIDGLSATTSPHHRPAQTPSKLLFHDLLTLCHYFFTNALSMFSWNDGLLSARNIKSFLRDPLDVRDLICQCMLGFLEFWAIVLGIPATLFLPGLMSLFLAGCLIPVIWGLAWILNDGAGHRVVRCCRRGSSKERDRRMARECVENGLDFGDERWIFIHGIMTSNQALHSHITHLSRIFRRPVLGIHQPTYGIFIDLLSSILLRTFSGFPTSTTNALYEQIRCACLDSSVEKIVLMSHGTGGIIISVVLDRLYADLPSGKDCLGKIEIYTFGNAAGWMNNPNRKLGNTFSARDGIGNINGIVRRDEEIKKTISHIEHYANENDILARWGILHNVREVLDNRYAGRVFILNGKGNILIGTGYLDHIWPICHEEKCDGSGKSCSNSCHIHSTRCENRGGCGNICNDHASGNECGIEGCKSQGIVCGREDCSTIGHKMVCTKLCKNADCDHERECEIHGSTCHGCEIHRLCDGHHNLVCSRGCKVERDCDHAKECHVHGKNCTGRHTKHHHHAFLDQVVDIDIDTAVKREFTAQKASIPQKIMPLNLNLNRNHSHSHTNTHEEKNSSVLGYNYKTITHTNPTKHYQNLLSGTDISTSPDISPKNITATQYQKTRDMEMQIKAAKRASWNSFDLLNGVDYAVVARKSASECQGMTVRQLSRLWRYVGGKRPVGEGVSMSNGVGNTSVGVSNGMGSGEAIESIGDEEAVVEVMGNGRVGYGAKVSQGQKVGK